MSNTLLRLVHNTALNNALRCITFALTFVETHHDARIASDPILAFLCVAFLHLIVENSLEKIVRKFCVSQINTMQGLVSFCEPALNFYIE